jgi:hypothetical protein
MLNLSYFRCKRCSEFSKTSWHIRIRVKLSYTERANDYITVEVPLNWKKQSCVFQCSRLRPLATLRILRIQTSWSLYRIHDISISNFLCKLVVKFYCIHLEILPTFKIFLCCVVVKILRTVSVTYPRFRIAAPFSYWCTLPSNRRSWLPLPSGRRKQVGRESKWDAKRENYFAGRRTTNFVYNIYLATNCSVLLWHRLFKNDALWRISRSPFECDCV